jgi:hypothetical protein
MQRFLSPWHIIFAVQSRCGAWYNASSQHESITDPLWLRVTETCHIQNPIFDPIIQIVNTVFPSCSPAATISSAIYYTPDSSNFSLAYSRNRTPGNIDINPPVPTDIVLPCMRSELDRIELHRLQYDKVDCPTHQPVEGFECILSAALQKAMQCESMAETSIQFTERSDLFITNANI